MAKLPHQTKRPVAKSERRSITLPIGFLASGATCGLKASGKSDLTLIVSEAPCTSAGVTTTSQYPGEPVKVARKHLRYPGMRAIVCNSGIANVATGTRGYADALAMAKQVASALDCLPQQVLPSSTGVIGQYLPMGKIKKGIDQAMEKLGCGLQADTDAATGILTTDLVTKTAKRRIVLGGKRITLAGIAKGSGMICPNMATMLCFITTDANISAIALRKALKLAVKHSFNRISIDHDTSTSDSVFILANGQAGNRPLKALEIVRLTTALTELCDDLAYQVVQDGEGASKVFRVHVKGARSQADADSVGKTVASSPLIKSAVHGSSPNWGRLIMAIGASEARIQPRKLGIAIGSIQVCQQGSGVSLSFVQKRQLDRIMRATQITFTITLGAGSGDAVWLGCDLSSAYVRINADYTT